MSYAYDPLEEEQRKRQDQEDQSLGGGTGSVLSGQNQSAQPQTNKKGSGQFVNLQNYLNDSNKNLGLDIANRLGQDVASAQEEQDKAKTNFTQAVDKGATKKDQSNLDFVTSNPYAAQQGYNQDTLKQYSQQPTKQVEIPAGGTVQDISLSSGKIGVGPVKQTPVSKSAPLIGGYYQSAPATAIQSSAYSPLAKKGDPVEFQKFIAQRDAMYKGPQESEDENFYSSAREKTRNAQEYGTNLATEQGKKAALQKYYGTQAVRPDYSQGQQNLDMYLGFSSPEAKQALAAQQEKARSLGDRFSGIQSELNNYRKQGISDTQAARKAARAAIGIDESGGFLGLGPIQELLNATKNRANQFSAQYKDILPKLTKALNDKDLTGLDSDTINKLNLNDVYSLYNLNPGDSKYLSFVDPSTVTQSGVTTQEEFDRLQALSGLAGIDQNWINQNQVGTSSNQPWSFDSNKFKEDLAAKRADYEKQRKQLKFNANTFSQSNDTANRDIDDVIALGNARSGFDYLKSDRDSAIASLLNFENAGGARQVLKSGRQNEQMDLPEDIKNDILRGYINPDLMYWAPQRQLINAFTQRSLARDLQPGGYGGLYGELYNTYANRKVSDIAKLGTRDDYFTYFSPDQFDSKESYQSGRGLNDYQKLLDFMKGPSWTPSATEQERRYAVGLPTISEDQLIKNYLQGKLTY